MQQTRTISPPHGGAQPEEVVVTATPATTGSTATLLVHPQIETGRGDHAVNSTQITSTRTHLTRLQFIQAACESQPRQRSVLSIVVKGITGCRLSFLLSVVLGPLPSLKGRWCTTEHGQKTTTPSYQVYTLADALLALRGWERHFPPLFERYQLSLPEVRETLLWAKDEFKGPTLVEDAIQSLVTRIRQEQYARRQQTLGETRNEKTAAQPSDS